MFRSTSLRLAALYTIAFALAVIALGAVTVITTRDALSRDFDARIRAEAMAMEREYRTEGLTGVAQAVRERDQTPGALDYGLEDPSGVPVAGRLADAKAPIGWSVLKIEQPGEDPEPVRVFTLQLPSGHRLLVGDDLERISEVDEVLVRSFALAFLGVVLLGVVGGYALSRGVHRQLDAITRTAEAIIDGDLTRRVPTRGSGDDLDRLATTINRMLDRIGTLMDSLKQVSNDIAHDLRTPLTRLRQRLEAGLATEGQADAEGLIDQALGDLDAILETFAALLRIAQIEAGARRAGFRPVDLGTIAEDVVDAFSPSAEDGGQRLIAKVTKPLVVEGDRELLTQMTANLVENALRHTPPGSTVVASARRAGDDVVLSVSDDGPGVPDADRTKLFDRFYRLERSRSTVGSGLGLALVAAVAKLHGARAELLDAAPGLEVRVSFAPSRRPLATDWEKPISAPAPRHIR